MTAVATCPRCQLQLSVPDEADSESVVKCPVCRSTFVLAEVNIAPVLEMIVLTHTPNEPVLVHREDNTDELQLADEVPDSCTFTDTSAALDALGGPNPVPLFSEEQEEQDVSDRPLENEDSSSEEDLLDERTTVDSADDTPLEIEDNVEESEAFPGEATPLESSNCEEFEDSHAELVTESMEIEDRYPAEADDQDQIDDDEYIDTSHQDEFAAEETEAVEYEPPGTSEESSYEAEVDPTAVPHSPQESPVDISRFGVGTARVLYQEDEGTIEQVQGPPLLHEARESDDDIATPDEHMQLDDTLATDSPQANPGKFADDDDQPPSSAQLDADDYLDMDTEADVETDESPDNQSDVYSSAPLPPLPGVRKRSAEDKGGSPGFRLMGILFGAILIVGSGGIGLWALWNQASRFVADRTVPDSSAPQDVRGVVGDSDDSSGATHGSFDAEFGEGSRYPVQHASVSLPADSDTYGDPHKLTDDQSGGGSVADYITNPPSYTLNDMQLVLELAKKAQDGLTTGSLNDSSDQFVAAKAESYARLCELAEVLTFYIDEPGRADRTMMLLEAKDIFRQSVREPSVQNDVALLARLWVDSPRRRITGDRGIFVTGELIDIRKRGGVFEYQLKNEVQTVSFITRDQLDERIFNKGESLVVAGSLVNDPANSVATYDGDSPRTIWAAVVKVLDDTKAAYTEYRLMDF